MGTLTKRPSRSLSVTKGVLATLAAAALAGCAVQLTAPYNEDIDRQAGELQLDFLRFAVTMQDQASTTKGYYTEHEVDYENFEARLAVMRLRSESQDAGLTCAWAYTSATKALGTTPAARPGGDAGSCITVLILQTQQQMEALRQLHKKLCHPGSDEKPAPTCHAIFAASPSPGAQTSSGEEAPALSAVSIVLNELVLGEQRLRPVRKA